MRLFAKKWIFDQQILTAKKCFRSQQDGSDGVLFSSLSLVQADIIVPKASEKTLAPQIFHFDNFYT